MDKSPLNPVEPLIVHPLPVASVFLGREAEIAQMTQFLRGANGVLSLVGVGGAGKTASVQRFLSRVIKENLADGVIVWSFYDDPDTNAFLRTAVNYFTGAECERQGSGWFQVLKQALEVRPRALLILDGLERVQRPVTNASGIYGELEDPLLRAFITRLATSRTGAKAILTSRFPIADLERLDEGYEIISVDVLPAPIAQRVLESHGVTGSKAELDRLYSHFGGHALTIDLLGAAIARYFGGKAADCPMRGVDGVADEGRAQRLAEVLRFFETGLTQQERDIMSRLCVFRFGVDIETLADIFAKSESSVGGSLAGKSRTELQELADGLTSVRLLYREEAGRYSVHPAVRDHFYGMFRESTRVHGAISEHLLSLSNRPGIGLPTTKEALDLLEELIYHALNAGQRDEAYGIYANRLGGNDHLNTTLGEYARTYRILQAFEACPDPGGMYHCVRAFGDYEEALRWRPQNRYIGLAQGKLVALRDDPSDSTRTMARFLMGERVAPPDRTPDFPVTAASLLILQGRLDDAAQKCRREIELSLYADDIVRSRMTLVDVYVRQGRLREAARELDEISPWVLRSGSQEHLCVFYLQTGRHELMTQSTKPALSSLGESLQLAEEAGFDLFAVDVLVALAMAHVAAGDLAGAEEHGRRALGLVRRPAMRYAWGEAAALSALVAAKPDQASTILPELLAIQKRIGHPDAHRTQRLVASPD